MSVCGPVESLAVAPGTIDARTGRAAYEATVKAAHLALAGEVDAIVTAAAQGSALVAPDIRIQGIPSCWLSYAG